MCNRVVLLVLVAFTACGPSAVVVPDAAPAPPDASTIPRSPAGTFALTGSLDLIALPAPADALVAELDDATDGPDDPARFLCDRLIAQLPEAWQAVAEGVTDVVAPYLETKLDAFAPHLASGLRSLAAGLGQIAHHTRTIEVLAVQPSGYATRTVTGVAYDATTIDFASDGISDAIAETTVTLDTAGNLQLAEHRIDLAYGRLLRLAFDREVIPSIDLDASDLSGALRDLVDCNQLGSLFVERAGIGTASFYAAACEAGMSALADEIYAQFAAIDASPLELDVTGTAIATDVDSDGTMDRISDGIWSGTSSYAGLVTPLEAATFQGVR